ncbi:MAG: radical SAM protein [Lachnospiraceae bacterium]|nr:radical SAM protein [Lachnospiraceae bacterium]
MHSINYDENKYLLYLPDTLKFFKANENVVKLSELICEGKCLSEVESIFPDVNEDIYKSIYNKLVNNEKAVKKYPTDEWDGYLPRLVIHISNNCNLKCKYCYAQGGNYLSNAGNITMEMLDNILYTFFGMFEKIDVISLFGGEPTLNIEAIERVAAYISDNGLNTKIGMITNGTVMDEKLAALIQKYDISVTLSIDQKDMQNNLRPFNNGNETYDKIKENVNILREVAKQPSQLEVVYTQAHVDNEISVTDVIKKLQFEFGKLPVHLTPVSTDKNDLKLKNEDAFIQSIDDAFIDSDINEKADYSFVGRMIDSLQKKQPRTNVCSAGYGTISVSVNGDIYPCFYFTDQEDFHIANVNAPLEDVKAQIGKIRRYYYGKSTHDLPECSTCFANSICYGCLGVNYFETGDPYKPSETHCRMVKKSLEKTLIYLSEAR